MKSLRERFLNARSPMNSAEKALIGLTYLLKYHDRQDWIRIIGDVYDQTEIHSDPQSLQECIIKTTLIEIAKDWPNSPEKETTE